MIACSGPPLDYKLFSRSLVENAELATYVVAVTLKWNHGGKKLQERYNTYQKRLREGHIRANQLLGRLPNLERLNIQIIGEPKSPLVPTFLQVNPAHRLRKVVISDFKTTVNNVALYLAQPSIQELDVGVVDPMTPFDDQTLAKIKEKGSPGAAISTLRLGAFRQTHLSGSKLHDLLNVPHSVDTICCPIPGREGVDFPLRGSVPRMADPLSPASIAYAFSPLQESLVNLYLCDYSQWPSHDLSRMDLSHFRSLQRLHVPSSCFFSSSSPQDSRHGVWKLLPESLKELSVSSTRHDGRYKIL